MKLYNYLNESYYRSLSLDEAKEILFKKCKKSWDLYIKHKILFYKGTVDFQDKYVFIEKNLNSVRMSQNTLNFYTLFINQSKEWSQYPKRQFIFTSNAKNATSYAHKSNYNNLYCVFPFDNEKIGVCPKDDMWNSFKKIKYIDTFFINLNFLFKNNDIDIDFNDFRKLKGSFDKFEEKMKSDDTLKNNLINIWAWANSEYDETISLYKNFEGLFNPDDNDFYISNGLDATLKDKNREVWCEGNVLLININEVRKILNDSRI